MDGSLRYQSKIEILRVAVMCTEEAKNRSIMESQWNHDHRFLMGFQNPHPLALATRFLPPSGVTVCFTRFAKYALINPRILQVRQTLIE